MDENSFVEHANHEREHWWFVARRQIFHSIINGLFHEAPNRAKVLEIGCGTGATMGRLADEYQALGADISNHAIRIAKQAYPSASFLAYQQIDQLDPHLEEADLVLLLDVIEHVEDDFDLISQVLRPMRPGSKVLITVPNDPQLWSEHDEAMFHFRRYTPSRLRMTWDGLPVTVRLLSGLNWKLAPLIRTVRFLGRISKRFRSHLPKRGDQSDRPLTDLSRPNKFLNHRLQSIFESEANAIHQFIDKPSASVPHSKSVSLIALIERTEGESLPRKKPADCPADRYKPPAYDLGTAISGRELV